MKIKKVTMYQEEIMTQIQSDIVIGTYKQRYEVVQAILKDLDRFLNTYDRLSDDLEIGFEIKMTIKEE
jgi:flagellar biosynthesis chaperone FliJ